MKPTEQEIQKAKKIMKVLFDKDLLGKSSMHKWYRDHAKLFDQMHIKLYHGQTKIVIVFCENWVVKTSFADYEADKNYCSIEAENYSLACEAGVEQFFAPTYEIGEVDGHLLFLQRRVKTDEGFFSDRFYKRCSEDYDVADFEDMEDYYNCISLACGEMYEDEQIRAIFGHEENVDSLISFVEEHNINDLHAGNWGFIGENCVLIDYSGF